MSGKNSPITLTVCRQLTNQVRNIASDDRRQGDLSSQKITVEAEARSSSSKRHHQPNADQLNHRRGRALPRAAREVGTAASWGSGEVRVSGTWRDLTDNVNLLARVPSLTRCGIAKVTTAVAKGDLRRRSPSKPRARKLEPGRRSTPWWTSSTFAAEVNPYGARGGYRGPAAGQAQVCPASPALGKTNERQPAPANYINQVRNIVQVTKARER